MIETYLDQLDAEREASRFLLDHVDVSRLVETRRDELARGEGVVISVWQPCLKALAVILRDDMNRSVLTTMAVEETLSGINPQRFVEACKEVKNDKEFDAEVDRMFRPME